MLLMKHENPRIKKNLMIMLAAMRMTRIYFPHSKSSSKSLLPDLIKNGVTCDLRLLNVGDLLWVAREKAAPGASLGMMGNAQPPRRELVLNYIVERKRLDDFVSSMIGGRMKEQKVSFVLFLL